MGEHKGARGAAVVEGEGAGAGRWVQFVLVATIQAVAWAHRCSCNPSSWTALPTRGLHCVKTPTRTDTTLALQTSCAVPCRAVLCAAQAIDANRHAVLMSLVLAHPLVQVKKLGNPGAVYIQVGPGRSWAALSWEGLGGSLGEPGCCVHPGGAREELAGGVGGLERRGKGMDGCTRVGVGIGGGYRGCGVAGRWDWHIGQGDRKRT